MKGTVTPGMTGNDLKTLTQIFYMAFCDGKEFILNTLTQIFLYGFFTVVA